MSTEHPRNTPIQIGDLRLDPRQRCVWRGEEKIQLPKLSFDLLLCLARHAPRNRWLWPVIAAGDYERAKAEA